jgi:tetratricopeptide (TPR) repeat protein
MIEVLTDQLARVDDEAPERRTPQWPKGSWKPAARAADAAYFRDQFHHEIAFLADQVAVLSELRQKYDRAARNPTRALPPDPQLARMPVRPLSFAQGSGYADALVSFDDLIQRYPDLIRAHQFRAMILAACPDPNLRDGQRAIAAATHAAELSNWSDPHVLSALAAAHAETGDFATAIRWEQRALELFAEVGSKQNPDCDRMSLYKAGKPYRMKARGLQAGSDERHRTP